jgi:DNA repair protein RecO (recombination protein O)
MRRSFTRTALILRSRPQGESNREVWFLSSEEGILRATVFGGPKSRLRAHVSPFHSGTLWLYHDPVRDSRKVTDFDVASWRPGIREQYERTMTAGAAAETVLASHGGGGNWKEAFGLTCRSLDALETAEAETCERIFIHFLWNWAALLGGRPGLVCSSCACEPADHELLWYDGKEGSFFCPRCAGLDGTGGTEDGKADGLLSLGPGGRRWLSAVEDLDPARLGRYQADAVSRKEIRSAVMAVMEGLLGKRPATWDEV